MASHIRGGMIWGLPLLGSILAWAITAYGELALIFPLVVGLIVTAIRYPAVMAILLFALFHNINVFGLQRLGFPELGLHLGDLVLIFALLLLIPRVLLKRDFRLPRDACFKLILLFPVAGLALAFLGFLNGGQPRSILNELRFFIYLPVILVYATAFLNTTRQVRRTLLSFYILTFITFLLIAAGVLKPEPFLRPGEVTILPTSAYNSAWHFVPPTFVGLGIVGLSLVAFAKKSLTGRVRLLLCVYLGVSATILVLSFTRAYWVPVLVMSPFLVTLERVRRRLVPLAFRTLAAGLVLAGLLLALYGGKGLHLLSSDLYERLKSSTQVTTEIAAKSRVYDIQATFNASLQSPIWGHGLGIGQTTFSFFLGQEEIGGAGMHQVYIYLLYRGGLVLLGLFLLLIFLVAWEALKLSRQKEVGETDRALSLGLALFIFFYATMGFFHNWTFVTNGLVGFALLAGMVLSLKAAVTQQSAPKPR